MATAEPVLTPEKTEEKVKKRNPIPMLAKCPNRVWSYDFMFDAL